MVEADNLGPVSVGSSQPLEANLAGAAAAWCACSGGVTGTASSEWGAGEASPASSPPASGAPASGASGATGEASSASGSAIRRGGQIAQMAWKKTKNRPEGRGVLKAVLTMNVNPGAGISADECGAEAGAPSRRKPRLQKIEHGEVGERKKPEYRYVKFVFFFHEKVQ